MADKKYTLSLEIKANGAQAVAEANRVGKAVDDAAKKAATPVAIPPSVRVGMSRPTGRVVTTTTPSGSGIVTRPGSSAIPDMVKPIQITADATAAIAVATQAKAEINRIGSEVAPWRVQMDRPAEVVRASGALQLGRGMSVSDRAALDDKIAKSVMMTIQADGAPAVATAEKIKTQIDLQGAQVKPWTVRLRESVGSMGVRAGALFGSAFSTAKMSLGMLANVAGVAFGAVTSGLRMAGRAVGFLLTAPIKLAGAAFGALKVAGVAAAAAIGSVYAAMKALGPAAEMQQYAMQIEVMLKSADKAKIRLAELSKFAQQTNYSPKQVIEAANLMQAFGFYSKRNLELAGDAANAFGKDIKEIVTSLNYLATGRGGEAFESLSRIGVTREKLKPFGVEFAKSGELVTEPKKALDAVLSYFSATFGGMTEKQAKTWKGAIETIGGEVYDAFARGFKLSLQPLTDFVKNRAIPLVGSIGDRLEQIKWDKILAKPLKMLGGVSELIRQAMDPKTSAAGMGNLKSFGAGLWDGLKDVIRQFPLVGKAIIRDLAGTLEAFVGSGGMGKVLSAGFDMLRLAWEVGASLMSAVLTSFSREFQSNLKVIAEKLIPGGPNVETNTRRRAEETAAGLILAKTTPEAQARIRVELAKKDAEEVVRKGTTSDGYSESPELSAKNAAAAANKTMLDTSPAMNVRMAREIARRSDKANNLWGDTISTFMGWDDQRTSPFYREPGAVSAQAKKISDTLGTIKLPISFSNTEAAVKDLKDKAAAAMSIPVDMLDQADRQGNVRQNLEQRAMELRKRRESLVDDPELARLKRAGWDNKGKERTSNDWLKNMQAKQARFDYGQRFGFVRSQVFNVDSQINAAEEAKAKNASRLLEDYQLKKMLQTPQVPSRQPVEKQDAMRQDRPSMELSRSIQTPQQEKSRDRQVEKLDDMLLMLGQTKLQQQAMLQQLQSINRVVAAVMGA